MCLKAEEQGGRAWLSLAKPEPAFPSPTLALKHGLLPWLNKVENPADIPSFSAFSTDI